MRSVRLAVLLTVWITVSASPLLGQAGQPREIVARQSLSCASCSIVLTRELEIGAGAAEYGGVTAGFLIQDSSGRYYHTSAYTPWAILVFDGSGEFERAIGAQGRGPGEFLNVWRARILPGDTLLAYDQGTGAFTAFSADGEHVYTVPVPARVTGFIRLSPGTLVVNTSRRTQTSGGTPLQLWNGSALSPIAASEISATDIETKELPLVRNLAWDTDSTFWSSHMSEYVLEQWHRDGRLLRRLRREDVGWMRHASRNTPEGRLNPYLYDVHVGPGGLLWVTVKARDAQWRQKIDFGPEGAPGVRGIRSKTGNLFDLHDGVLEVLDPVSGEILASTRMDELIHGFVGSDRLYTFEQDELGVGTLVVHRFSLERSARR